MSPKSAGDDPVRPRLARSREAVRSRYEHLRDWKGWGTWWVRVTAAVALVASVIGIAVGVKELFFSSSQPAVAHASPKQVIETPPDAQFFQNPKGMGCVADVSNDVVTVPCRSAKAEDTAQYWLLTIYRDDSRQIKNAATHRCMAVVTKNVVTLPCDKSERTSWEIYARHELVVQLQNQLTKACLEVNSVNERADVVATKRCREDVPTQEWQ